MSSLPKAMFAVDLDSTLYDFSTPAREAFLKLYEATGDRNYRKGAYVSWDEWRSPADACGMDTWLQVIDMCHAPEVIEQQRPYPGSAETLQALEEQGFGFLYISNRGEHSFGATRSWLNREGFPNGENLVCTMEDKGPYLRPCQYLIDDRPKTLIEFVYDSYGINRKAIGLMYPYNRALTDVPDIFLAPTWAGLNNWLARKGLLYDPDVVLEA